MLDSANVARFATVLGSDATCIGLLRSEFLYMNRANLPSEEEQYNILLQLAQRLDRRPLTIRTLDAGGDKMPTSLAFDNGPNRHSGCALFACRSVIRRFLRPNWQQFCALAPMVRCESCCR